MLAGKSSILGKILFSRRFILSLCRDKITQKFIKKNIVKY